MAIYDILMIIVFVGAIFFGWWKGLSWQVASLASVVVSYFVSMNFYGVILPYLDISAPWNRFAAMLIMFLATSLAIWIGFGYVRTSIDKLKLDGFDHQAGAILGAFKGGLLCMLITMFAVTLLPGTLPSSVINSASGNFFARSLNQLSMTVPEEIHAILGPRLERMNLEFVEHGKDPTQPISLDNRGNWFEEGTVQLNTGQNFNNSHTPYEGQIQTAPENAWPDINFRVNSKDLIDRGVQQIGQGLNQGLNGFENR